MKTYRLDVDSRGNPVFVESGEYKGRVEKIEAEESIEVREEKTKEHEAIPEQNKEKGKCEYCGTEFPKGKPNKKFCSIKCRVAYNRTHKK